MTLHAASYDFPLPSSAAAPSSRWTLDQGVDIAAPAHTPLLAIAAGTIVGHGINGFGDWAPILRLDDGSGYVYYGHAGPAHAVPVGTHVSAGQTIGEVGAGRVGISTGPHLEIGFAKDASGTPIGSKTAATMKELLSGGTKIGTPVPSGGADAQTGGASNAGPESAKVATGLAADVAGGVVNLLWSSIGGSAMKILIYVLLVGGGLALALSGARHLATTQEAATAA
jgi:hypothetical protein